MIKRLIFTMLAALGLVAGVTTVSATSSPVSADTMYTASFYAPGPTMYQSNLTYKSAPTQTPASFAYVSSGTLNDVKVSYSTNVPVGTRATLCNSEKCVPLTANNTWTSAFAGTKADTAWTISYYASSSKTTVYPSPYRTGDYQITMEYTIPFNPTS